MFSHFNGTLDMLPLKNPPKGQGICKVLPSIWIGSDGGSMRPPALHADHSGDVVSFSMVLAVSC